MRESRDLTLVLWIVVIGCNIHAASGAYELLLSCGNSVANGSDCTMTCDTKDPTVTAILWLNGSTTTTIDKDVDCTDTGDLPYEASCNTPGKFDLKITNAQYGRDSYAWSCTSAFGGDSSNVTDGETFVTVPLTRVTLTRPTATSISCVAVSSPAATVTLHEGSPPSQDNVVKNETSFTKTLDGLETKLTSSIEKSKTYYCHADNGVGSGVTSVPESPTTASPTTPSPPEPTTATPTSTATTTSTEITKPVCENVIICIIVGCIGGVAVVTVIFICCCCCSCCLPSCFPSKCPCCCRGAWRKKRKTSRVTGGTNGQTRTTSAEGKERVPIDDYPTSEKTGGDYLKKRNGGVDSEDILIKIPDGQSDGMRDDRVPTPDGRSEVRMHRL